MNKSEIHKRSIELLREFVESEPEELHSIYEKHLGRIDEYNCRMFTDLDMIGYANWFRNVFNPFELFNDPDPLKKWGKWDSNNEMLKYTDREVLEEYLKFDEEYGIRD